MSGRVLVVALAGALVVSGCVGGGRSTVVASPGPSALASESSGQRIVVGVPSAKGKATLVLADRSVVMWGTQGDWEGPRSFFVVGDEVTVIDHVPEDPLLRVYRNGKEVDYFGVPERTGYAVDLLIRDGRHWLLNWESADEYRPSSKPHRLVSVSQTKVHESEALPEDVWIAADGESVVAQVSIDGPELVAGPGPVTPEPDYEQSGKSVLVDDGPVRLQLNLRHKHGDCTRIAQTFESTYYWARDFYSGRRPFGGYVYKVGRDGQVQEVFTLQRTGQWMDRRMIRVADDGKVYQMVVADRTMKVYQIHPNP